MAKAKVWRSVVEALEAEGVRYLFGLPGNPENLYNDLYGSRVKAVLVRHETSSVFMAMAYARVAREPGVLYASAGPGMANLVPGLLEAWAACSPVVAFVTSAGLAYDGMGAFQEADQLGMARPVAKWAVRLLRPERTPWTVRRAFSIALNGKPGPVYVEVPGDVGKEEAEMPPYRCAERGLRPAGDPAAVARAAELIVASQRPVILAGGGVVLSGAEGELRALAERLRALVVTTPSGRGSLPEDHRLAFGLVGLYRTRSSALAFDGADLVVNVGSRFEEFQSGLWRYFPRGAKLVQIDIDPFEVGRNLVPDVGVVGDARLVLGQLLEELASRGAGLPPRRPWVEELVREKEAFEGEVDAECSDADTPIKSKRIVHEINRVFGRNTILVNENGGQDLWSYYCPYFKVLEVGGCVPPAEQTCMGFGVAGAIGAKLAAPQKQVVCVSGDAAFQMFMQEVSTAVQYQAPVTWVVLDNSGLGWPRYIARSLGERYVAVDFTAQPDLAAFAKACGCHGERVELAEEVAPALDRARRANQEGTPAVLDFIVDTWDYPEGFHAFHGDVRAVPQAKTKSEKEGYGEDHR